MSYKILLSLFSFASAIPTLKHTISQTSNGTSEFGFAFDGDLSNLPLLKLPYATYRAKTYHEDKDYYHFANIRYAAPPVGDLRFAKPQPPPNETKVQDGSVGWACHQTETSDLLSFYFEHDQPTSEDCLFLDIYVPGKAARKEVINLPVLDWIYAGGYVFGSKDMWIYDTGMWVENADNDLIYVAGNHRMGAFGFLTGPTVEQEATSNVGLLDQRAILQWIQDYVPYIGGDKNAVTAWGLSSGAGSIMHHLTAQGGKSDPLFQRAIMNSPAFVPTYDPPSMETSFEEFAALLGCEGKGISCLRGVSEAALQNASAYTCTHAQSGKFGFGPAIDHEYILDLPGRELAKGNYWSNVTLLFSHTINEGAIFTDKNVTDDSMFQALVEETFPNITAAALQQLNDFYPNNKNETTTVRLENLISKWAVTCNTRWLAKAYEGKSWGYRFNVTPGYHGEDTAFNWWRLGTSLGKTDKFDINFLNENMKGVAGIIQSYIASFARTGNPNTYRSRMVKPIKAMDIPLTVVGETLNLLNVGATSLEVVDDLETIQDECDWWQEAAWTGLNYPHDS